MRMVILIKIMWNKRFWYQVRFKLTAIWCFYDRLWNPCALGNKCCISRRDMKKNSYHTHFLISGEFTWYLREFRCVLDCVQWFNLSKGSGVCFLIIQSMFTLILCLKIRLGNIRSVFACSNAGIGDACWDRTCFVGEALLVSCRWGGYFSL